MMKKLTAITITFALAVCALLALAPSAAATDLTVANYRINEAGGTITGAPRLLQGETWKGGKLRFEYIGPTPAAVTVSSVEMIPDIDVTKFPFDIRELSYLQTAPAGSTDNGMVYTIDPIRVRGDAPANFYDIPFLVRYRVAGATPEEQSEFVYMRVLVAAVDAPVTEDGQIAKVIVSASVTNPTDVVAGEDFVLGVTFKNTSSEHTISNLKASLAADSTFKPVSGSSTLFIAAIGPGESKSASLRLTSKSDTAPGSYTASFALNYDAPNTKDNAPVTDTEVIAIPVKQVPRVMVTKMQIQPGEIYVGQDINVMSTVNNTGKSKIYNLNVNVDDSSGLLTPTEAYLGNVDSGGTGTVDLYITPTGTGDSTVTMHISYEDENGAKYTAGETQQITVMDNSMGGGEMPIPEMIPEEQPKGMPWWLWLVGGLAVAGTGTLIAVKKAKKKHGAERDREAVKELNAKYLKERNEKSAESAPKQEAKK